MWAERLEAAGWRTERFETPLGAMFGVAGDAGLYYLNFVDGRGVEESLARLAPEGQRGEGAAHLERLREQLAAYFEGRAMRFEVPLVGRGTPFEKRVWDLLLAIPPGAVWSYSEIAARLGNAKTVRAVGRANGRNPISVLIPCHRVIGADGHLCGYGGGLERKRWLLDHERYYKQMFDVGCSMLVGRREAPRGFGVGFSVRKRKRRGADVRCWMFDAGEVLRERAGSVVPSGLHDGFTRHRPAQNSRTSNICEAARTSNICGAQRREEQ